MKRRNKRREAIPLAPYIERFFGDYLTVQRNLSPATVSSYRDTFRLLLQFLWKHAGITPALLTFADLDASQVLRFLDYLERDRDNSVRSRNARLAAIRAFARYAALQEPACLPTTSRILAVPLKRFDRATPEFLSRKEIMSIMTAPNPESWSGQRDQVMFATMYNTGARVSEIVGANIDDLRIGPTCTLSIRGKGRKERIVPLWKTTKDQLQNWLACLSQTPGTPLFPNRRGERLTRSGVRTRLHSAICQTITRCSSLKGRRVTPHVFRRTTAMHLLQSGLDLSVIALWLGHESAATTHIYMEVDLEMKKRAIEKITGIKPTIRRFKPGDRLLAFLEAL
jgi:site-specific recombinase XerD